MIRSILRTYRAAFSGLPRDLWLLALVALVNRSGSMVLPFITLYLTRERGFSVAQAGQVLGLYGLGSIAGGYLGGWLSDRIGATRTQQLSLIGSGFCFLALGQARSIGSILVAIAALSVVAESFRPANMSAIAQHAPPELKGRAFALLRLAINLALGIGPAVGGFLALYSYQWLFVVDAATSWAAAGLIALVLPGADAGGRDTAGAGAEAPRSPWRDVPFLWLMLLVTVLAVVVLQILSTFPLYLSSAYGLRENGIGLLLALNGALIVAFEMVLIYWAERREPMFLIGLGSFLVCAGFALMPFGRSSAFAALTVIIWTLGEMLAFPLVNAVVAQRATGESRGRYLGFYTMTFGTAFMLAPALGTWVYDRYGPSALWYGVGLVGVFLWLGALALIEPFRRSAAARRGTSELLG